MSAAVDELFAIIESVGGTVTLHGHRVSARDLKSFAWSGFVERFAESVARAACTELVVPREPQWSPYPYRR